MADKEFSKIVKQNESSMIEISLIDVDTIVANYMGKKFDTGIRTKW